MSLLLVLLLAAAAAQYRLGGAAAGALGLVVALAAGALTAALALRAKPERAVPLEADPWLRAATDLSPDGLLAVEPSGAIRWANPAAARVFGCGPDDLLGRELDALLPGEPAGGAPAEREAVVRRADGSSVPVAVSSSAPGDAGGLAYVRVRDLSERRTIDERLRRAQRTETVGRLVGGLAHDFNNQLTVILAYSGLLADALAGRDEKLRRMAESVRAAARSGAELTRQLLTFGRRDGEPGEIDLGALLKSLQPLLRSAIGERVEFDLRLAKEPLRAHADPSQLEAAIIGLAAQAREAMPDGALLTIECAAMTRQDGERGAAITVHAEGAGALAFSAPGAEIGEEGPGLGIARRVAARVGGAVAIESRAAGVAAILSLPLLPLPEAAPEPQGSEDAASAGQTILVVEDEPLVRDFVTAQLRRLGYFVIEAPDGPSALAELERAGPIDLVFTDLVMPRGMSGFALAEAARRKRPGLRFLFTTGYSADEACDGSGGLADQPVLRKPYELRELAASVQSALRQSAA